MNKLFFISIALIAVVLGFYWLRTNSGVENRAVDQPKIRNDAVGAVSLPLISAKPSQLQKPYSGAKDWAGSKGINPNLFMAADDYDYHRHKNKVINVGQIKDANISLYQIDDSEVITVGEIIEVDMPNSTY